MATDKVWFFLFMKNNLFKMLGLLFSSKLYLGSYILSNAKAAFKKIEALVCSVNCLCHLRLLLISINSRFGLAWNTVVMSVLVFLVVLWKCWISYRNGYVGLLVLHLLQRLNSSIIVKM